MIEHNQPLLIYTLSPPFLGLIGGEGEDNDDPALVDDAGGSIVGMGCLATLFLRESIPYSTSSMMGFLESDLPTLGLYLSIFSLMSVSSSVRILTTIIKTPMAISLPPMPKD